MGSVKIIVLAGDMGRNSFMVEVGGISIPGPNGQPGGDSGSCCSNVGLMLSVRY
jgi:hypothetical protein